MRDKVTRLALACATFLACVPAIAPASAADMALDEAIGYSENLRYFAFEEFGIQDGSGLAYSSIYIVDLSEDRWVVGTPIEAVAENEEVGLDVIRAKAHMEAQTHLDDLSVKVPAHLLAANADGEPDMDGKTLTFALPVFGGTDWREGRYRLELTQFPAESGSPCVDWFGEGAMGFTLKMTDFSPTHEVHRDAVLPRSRGCPADYRIHAVYAPFQATNIANTLAIISVYARGFEGLDRRFIAVALAKSQVGL